MALSCSQLLKSTRHPKTLGFFFRLNIYFQPYLQLSSCMKIWDYKVCRCFAHFSWDCYCKLYIKKQLLLKGNTNMNIFIISLHPELKSFNGTLKDLAILKLTSLGHQVKVLDLYAIVISSKLLRLRRQKSLTMERLFCIKKGKKDGHY